MVKHPIWFMPAAKNFFYDNDLKFTYVFIDYFKILILQGYLDGLFAQFIRLGKYVYGINIVYVTFKDGVMSCLEMRIVQRRILYF